jgi:hypothetical protein
MIGAGDSLRLLDDRIEMESYPCQRLIGKVNLLIKYGLAGNEIYELPVKGNVTVVMEHFGFAIKSCLNQPGNSMRLVPPNGGIGAVSGDLEVVPDIEPVLRLVDES